MFRQLALTASLLAFALPQGLSAAEPAWPADWTVIETDMAYGDLVASLDKAVTDNKMGLVTRASATVGVKKMLEEDIPGNMVVGVYRPDFAKRMLAASVPAGMEAPVRFYITEDQDADGGSTLAYKAPSLVFAPYDDGGAALDEMAVELDAIFDAIAKQATGM